MSEPMSASGPDVSVASGPGIWIAELPGPLAEVQEGGRLRVDQIGRLVRPGDQLLFRSPVDGGAPSDLRVIGMGECSQCRPDPSTDGAWTLDFETIRTLRTPLTLTRSTAGPLWTLSWFRDQRPTLHGLSPRERALLAGRSELVDLVSTGPLGREPEAVVTIDELLAAAAPLGPPDGPTQKAAPSGAVSLSKAAGDATKGGGGGDGTEGGSRGVAIDRRLVELGKVWGRWMPWWSTLIGHPAGGDLSELLGPEEPPPIAPSAGSGPESAWAPTAPTGWAIDQRDLGDWARVDALARLVGDGPTADERHLTATVLLRAGDGSQLADSVRAELLAGVEPDEVPLWRAAMGGKAEVLPLAPITADRPTGEDALDRMPDVRAFAKAIAARSLAPPLAIGVFGDWGSGKSFFMAKLQEEIQAINNEVYGLDPEAPTAFCERVAQVEFNAWHYVETDLWTSLVHHLLANLKVRYGPREDKARQITREITEEVLERLDQARGSVVTARAEVERQEAAVAEAEEATSRGRADLERARLEASRYDAADVLRATMADEEMREKVAAARRRLGLDSMARTLGDVTAAADEAIDVARRGWTVLRLDEPDAERSAEQRRRLWRRIGLAVAVAVLTLAIGLVIDRAVDSPAVGGLVALGGELLAGAQAAAAWLRRQTERADAVVEELVDAQARLRAQERARAAGAEARLKALQDEETDAREELERKRATEDEARRQLSEVRERAAGLTVERRLIDFVESRTASYEAHLGLVSSVRRDLDRLRELIVEWRKACDLRRGLREASQEDSATLARLAELAELTNPEDQPFGGLDRLVVYIDDLDRCPPHKVVRVLEAVHLLLAFDFIVVVVGVDARWVGNALRSEYPLLLGGRPAEEEKEKDGSGEEADPPPVGQGAPGGPGVDGAEREHEPRPATEHDYLEKIFQIPYWLEPMDRTATGRLVGRLFGPARVERTEPAGEVDQPVPTGGSSEIDLLALDDDARRRIKELRARMAAVAEFDPQPAELLMTREELELLPPLHDLIGRSPRSTKRFANVYRVLRASLDEVALDGWVPADPDRDCDAMAVLLLLALICGAPQSSAAVFHEIDALADQDIPGPPAASPAALFDAIERGLDPDNPDEGRRWAEARQELEGSRQWRALTTTRVKAWLTRTAQYSFRSGHLDFQSRATGPDR